jgi:WD40 repeat protein
MNLHKEIMRRHNAPLKNIFLVCLMGLTSCQAQTISPNQTTPNLSHQRGRIPIVFGVAFSPNGEVVASASDDKIIRLWDLKSGREIQTLNGHTNGVYKSVFSPDGKLLASCSVDQSVKIWEVATGRELRTLSGHTQPVKALAFSPDGKLLASASNDGTVKLWDAAAGKEQRTLKHTQSTPSQTDVDSSVYAVAFSPDGKYIASGNGDATVSVWETATGREVRIMKGHTGTIWAVPFSPDGRLIASASWDNTAIIWDAASGREIRKLGGEKSAGIEAQVRDAAFSPDGRWLATSEMGFDTARRQYAYNRIRIWDVATGREAKTLTGHAKDINSIAFSPDGRKIASGSADETVKIWDVGAGRELLTFRLASSGKISREGL